MSPLLLVPRLQVSSTTAYKLCRPLLVPSTYVIHLPCPLCARAAKENIARSEKKSKKLLDTVGIDCYAPFIIGAVK